VRQRLDESGQVAAVNGYRPFGSPLEGDGGEPYGFTGEWWEADLNLLYLRARWYAPSQGRFLSEDSIPGFAERPLTQHLWLYALDNPVHYIDPSGHQVQPPDCKPGDICATGTFGPYTPSLPAYGYEPPEPVPHYYNRQAAVNYALRYACGANYNYYKLSVDCTNFVSQALAAGGLPMTPKWRAQQELLAQLLSRLGFGFPRGCGSDPWDAPCTPAWSAAPDLYSYLKNYLGYPSYNLPKVEQAAKDSDTPPPNMANSPIPIQPGDVVFYRNEEHTEFNHTALVIGWGPPSYFQNEKKDQDCSADLPGEWSNVFNPESDRLPWIIDHGGPNYKRAFNDIGSTNEVEFVHIPDFLGEW
jgi:RHS repeat-associated protein